MLKFKKFMDEETQLVESHFKVGDKVKCVHSGKEGVVTKVDPSEKGKYYTVKRDDGEVMQYAPDDLEALKEEVELDEAAKMSAKSQEWYDKGYAMGKNPSTYKNPPFGIGGAAMDAFRKGRKAGEAAVKKEEVELDEADTYAIYKKGKVFDTFRSKEDAHDSLDSMGLSPMSKKDYRVRKLPASHSNSWSMKEEVQLDETKVDRMAMIRKAVQRVQAKNAQDAKRAAAAAKRDMKAKGAQRGMAPVKKDLEEGRNEALKALEGLAKRGGMDKADFQKAHDLYKAGKLNDLRKHIYGLDTDPSEAIADVINRHDSKAFNSMYPRAKSGDYIRKTVLDHGGK